MKDENLRFAVLLTFLLCTGDAWAGAFGGSPWGLPGQVEAENYDTGGEGVAYHDATGGNAGSTYRNDDVDIWNDTGGEGYFVGAMSTGEWLSYTVNVTRAGSYDLQLRVATPKDRRKLHVEFGGVNRTGTVTVPATGDWTAWQMVGVPVTLSAGVQTMRVFVENGGLNLSRIVIQAGAGSTPDFADDFNDGNAGGWSVVNDSGTASAWSVSGGKYRQSRFVGNFGAALDKGYHRGTYAFLPAGAARSSYRFAAEVTPTAVTGEEVGVLFYYQNNNNYYRFVTSLSDGFTRLERKAGGVFRTLAQNARGYDPGTVLKLVISIRDGVIQVVVNGGRLMSAYDTALTGGTVGLYARDGASFDNVSIASLPAAPSIAVAYLTDRSVVPKSTFGAQATVLNLPSGGSVAFDLDGNPSSCSAAARPNPGRYTATCSAPAGVHALSATLRNGSGTVVDTHRLPYVATGGNIWVTIGDSNTWGEGDLFSLDGVSTGGWRKALHGYQTNLLSELDQASSKINLAFNESVRGDTMNRVLSERLPSYLERDAGANFAIVWLGTNDANGTSPVASGLHCGGSACNGTFKGQLKGVVAAIRNAGMTPVIVQVPPRWGDGVPTAPYANPVAQPVNAVVIAEYNQVIRRQDANPLSGYVIGPNLLHYYLTGGSNRFHLFYDNLHLSGLGLKILAAQLRNTILGGSELPFVIEGLCVRKTSGGGCVNPTPYKQDLLEPGDAPYVDSARVLTGALPPALDSGRWIRTAIGDRNLSHANYLSFTVSKRSTVYVALDAGAGVPSWMTAAGFANSGAVLQTDVPNATSMKVYAKTYPAGTVTLGGANAAITGADANLLVIVK